MLRCLPWSSIRCRGYIAPQRCFHFSRTRLQSHSDEIQRFSGFIRPPGVLKPILFVFGVSSFAYLASAKLTNLDTELWAKKIGNSSAWYWPNGGVSSAEMKRARIYTLVENAKRQLDDIKRATFGLPTTIRYAIIHSYTATLQKWVNTGEGSQLCYKVAALNGLVWLAWQVPRFQPFMGRFFVHNPLSGISVGLLSSVFSHQSFIHLLFNMIALSSFGHTAFLWMEKAQAGSESRLQESTAGYHFLSFFVTAGLSANLVSHIASARWRFPRALKEFANKTNSKGAKPIKAADVSDPKVLPTRSAASSIILPSLGASGAVYSTLVVTALAFPDAHVSLIFPPTPPIPIQYGVTGLVCLDMIGILRGWRLFDHWAHLGGAAFGALYWKYGAEWWDKARVLTL